MPRKLNRVEGWTEERQRAFIAALAATGSKRRFVRSIVVRPASKSRDVGRLSLAV